MAQIHYPDYQHLWDTMELRPGIREQALHTAGGIYADIHRYQSVVPDVHVPWEVIAVLHYRESGCDFKTHLANGDPLTARTKQVPAGLPETGTPPFTWEEGAIAALNYDDMFKQDWDSLPGILKAIEEYNGTGYLRYHTDVLSPYLWSGSFHYSAGKYDADGHFNPTLVDKQLGAAVLYRFLTDKTLGVVPK